MVYSLDALQLDYQKGKTYKFLFFWGHTPPVDGSINQSCLSQWWMQAFEINGTCYSCAEQYMMAEKARLFHDKEMLEKIMQAVSPKEMKAYGRAVQDFDKNVWESNCFQIVKDASREKFSQNPDLLQFLLGTRERILVEASPRDRIWGIGMGKNNPDAENPMKWRGRNLLGFALTEVRDNLLGDRELADLE
jgi:ribA/ribD-fused uncharacterized protein